MANPITSIILTAVDKTKAAFLSAKGGLASIGETAAGLKATLAGLFTGISVAVFVGQIRRAIDEMDEVGKAAKRAGTSVESFSALNYAASQTGVQDMEKSLIALSDSLDSAKDGTGAAAEAFAALRIDPAQFRDPADALVALAERFAELPNGVDKTALAIDIFGKRLGPGMIPLLNEGAEGIRRYREEAEALGKVISNVSAEDAERFNDNLDKLKSSSDGLGISLAQNILPQLTQVSDAMTEAAKDGSLLKAAWVGLGGLGAALFTDDLLSNTEKLAKAQNDLARATEAAAKVGIGDTAYITRQRAQVKALQDLVDAENKAAAAKTENAKASAKAARDNERAMEARQQDVESFKQSVNEQITDAERLQAALQTAFGQSVRAEEDYLRRAKKLRDEASGKPQAGSDPESQAVAALDATIAAMRLQREAGTANLESVQDQAEALREMAGRIDDVGKAEEFRRQANLAEAAALERAAAEERDRYRGLAEQQAESARQSKNLKDALDGIGKEISVDIKPGAQMAQVKQELTDIKHLIDYIKANPVKINLESSGNTDAIRTSALQHGRRR